MNRLPTLLCALAAGAMLSLPAQADMRNGADLHRQHCQQCHTSMVGGDGSTLYIRPNRRVTSLTGLGKQVRLCRDNLRLVWFDDQVQDVVDYLNQEHYKFSP